MDDKEKLKSSYKIIGINLLLLFVYAILVRTMTDKTQNEAPLGMAIEFSFIIAIHIIICLIAAAVIVGRSREWLLSALLVLIIGFSTCFWVAS